MNLQTHIKKELWLAISSTYETESYSHSVLDAMHYLSDVIRDKSNIDGDGASLVGQALGGNTPRLRVNKLQTETERNIQKGLEQILRGLYQGIRNPRSHEQIKDTKDEADAVIYFIHYLLKILDKSEEPFTLFGFTSRVFDPDFVESTRYAELLAAEIPAGKRAETLIEIYRRKDEAEGRKLKYMVRAILDSLTNDQKLDFLAVVSDDLKTTRNETDIKIVLQIIPPDLWLELNEVARLRVENKLLKSISEGRLDPLTGKTDSGKGAFGTWGRDFLKNFKQNPRARNAGSVLLKKMEGETNERAYVARFFLNALPDLCETSYSRDRYIRAICKAVKNNEEEVRKQLSELFGKFPSDWQKEIIESLKDLEQTDPDFYNSLDEIPF